MWSSFYWGESLYTQVSCFVNKVERLTAAKDCPYNRNISMGGYKDAHFQHNTPTALYTVYECQLRHLEIIIDAAYIYSNINVVTLCAYYRVMNSRNARLLVL